jgi:hypothetical protein
MNPGQRVKHEIYGLGTIIAVDEGQETDGVQANITGNGWSRYTGAVNISVKFDIGGPQGWAYHASNNIKDLRVVE